MTPAEQAVAALRDRQQRAREAYYDRVNLPERHEPAALDDAIETAVRVRVTPEILNAAKPTVPWLTEKQRLEAAFAAAGFKVEE